MRSANEHWWHAPERSEGRGSRLGHALRCAQGRATRRQGRATRDRRGLAPLEMVMALPILLLVMALMVNYGVASAWKVRALGAARHGLWGNRVGRSLANDPVPTYPLQNYWPPGFWPGPVPTAYLTAPPDDSQVDLPVGRGPSLQVPPSSMPVNPELLDPSRGLVQGNATVTVPYPLLGKALGNLTLKAQDTILDDCWQFTSPQPNPDYFPQSIDPTQATPAIPGSNWALRIPSIYKVPSATVDPTTGTDLSAAYLQAVMAIYNYVNTGVLSSFYGTDSDDMKYRVQFGYKGLPYSTFTPRLAGFCSPDKTAAQPNVDALTAQIQDVPKIMAGAYLLMYQTAQQQLQDMLSAQPPPSPAQMASIQSEIQQIQSNIDQLN